MDPNIKAFELCYNQLKSTFTTFVDNAMKTLASIMIAIGWLLTSDSSRDFISKHQNIYFGSIITIVFIYFIHSFVNYGLYKRSKKLYIETCKISFSMVSEEVISTSLITFPHLIGIQLMNGIVSFFLILIIIQL